MKKENRDENPGYIVVFRGRGDGKGNHKGVTTWTSYRNREEFVERWENNDNSDEIVAEGVTQEKAIELVRKTPIQAYVNAAVRESTVNGQINDELLGTRLVTIQGVYPEKSVLHKLRN